jgi:4-hydroxy-2-oxoheptanedioate aldolase
MKTLSELFSGEGPVLGTWSQIGAPEVVDILGAAGFHFTILDTEHGSFGMDSIENLVRACDAAGIVPIVRVPSFEQSHITRALDAGAQAVIVPGIRSAEEAARAVAGGRFAPAGLRGACPCVRAGGHWIADWPSYATAHDQDTGVIVLAETPGALDEVEAICALDGLKALMIGPFDLSVALGHQGRLGHPEVAAAIRRMVDAAVANDVPSILPIFAPELSQTMHQIEYWRGHGVEVFTIGTDKILLHSQGSRFTKAALAPAT